MDFEQYFRLSITFVIIILFLLFFAARANKIVVYRNFSDLAWSLSIIYTPIISVSIIIFIGGEDQQIISLLKSNIIIQSIVIASIIIIIYSIYKTISLSIEDNGSVLGFFIGLCKILVSVLVSVLAISLFKYLFRDDRKIGHVFIFTLLFGIFSWFMSVLINGNEMKQRMNNDAC